MNTSRRFLVVDDDLAARVRTRDLLEREGHRDVKEAADGFTALELARATPPDLILLDVMMPGMSGLEVCAALRRDPRTREVPIFVLSAADESDAMLAALEAGADDFLSKPFSASELRAKVRTVARLNRFRALHHERDRLRWLLDRSPEPLLIAAPAGTVAYANARAHELFGLVPDQAADVATAIGRGFRCEPPDALSAWRAHRWPADKSFMIFQPEAAGTAARWFEVESQTLDGPSDGTLLRFVNRSDWVRGQLETFTFQHLIARRIRTPLHELTPAFSSLERGAHAVQANEVGSPFGHQPAESEQVQHTLLDILRAHAAVFGSDAVPTGVSFSSVVERAAGRAGIDRAVHVAGEPPAIAFPELLEVVLTEVFDEYVKGGDAAEASLHVACGRTPGGWEVRLCTPGVELPPEVVAALGRPYWISEHTASAGVEAGPGLATARQLLRWRGGDLRLERNAALRATETRIVLSNSFFT